MSLKSKIAIEQCFKNLGFSKITKDKSKIKSSYLKLIKKNHPDSSKKTTSNTVEKTQELTQSFNQIMKYLDDQKHINDEIFNKNVDDTERERVYRQNSAKKSAQEKDFIFNPQEYDFEKRHKVRMYYLKVMFFFIFSSFLSFKFMVWQYKNQMRDKGSLPDEMVNDMLLFRERQDYKGASK